MVVVVVELLLSLKLKVQPYWFHHVGARLISRGVLSLPGASFWQPQSLVPAIFHPHIATISYHSRPSTSSMNGVNGNMVPPALWQEARNADGRVYYYNTITKVTQWDKPVELMTPVEVSSMRNLFAVQN